MTTIINNEHKKLNVPNLRFPEFSGEWEKKKMKDVCTFYSGGTPSSSNKDYYNGDIPFIRSGELHSDKTELFISSKGLKNSSAKMVSKGDLLLALYGATSGDIAISQIEGAINQAILCIKTDQSKGFIEATWCKHVKRILQTYLQGGQGNLSADIVKNIAFYFAPLKEQEKLTQLMKLLDDRIAAQNKIIEDLKKLKCAISRIVFRNATLVKIQNLCEVIMGQSPSSSSYNSNGDGLPLIQGNLDILDGVTISRIYTNEPTKISLQNDLILTVRAPVGIVAENKMKVCIGRGVCALRNKSAMPTMYIYYALDYFSYKWKQIEQGSTFTSINGDDVKNFTIPLVDDAEYSCAFLSKVDALIKCSINLHSNYIKQKQYLFSQMFI